MLDIVKVIVSFIYLPFELSTLNLAIQAKKENKVYLQQI